MKLKQPVLRHNGPLFLNIRHVLVGQGAAASSGIKRGFRRKSAAVANIDSYFSKNNPVLFGDNGNNSGRPEPQGKQEPSASDTSIWGRIRKFCIDSSLHVVKYIPDRERSISERIFWTLVFTLSVCVSVLPILQAWDRYKDDSLSVVMQQSEVPVWDIPFPEVVICNEAPMRSDVVKNLKNDPETLKNFSLFCTKYPPPEGSLFTKEGELVDFVKKFFIPLSEFAVQDYTLSEKNVLNTSIKHLTARFSDLGLCYSFNALPHDQFFNKESSLIFEDKEDLTTTQWNLDSGYYKPWFDEMPTPKRALGSGYRFSYGVLLKRKKNLVFPNCAHPNAGFKIAVKNPADSFSREDDFMRVTLGRGTNFLITPKLVTTDDAVRSSMQPIVRECYFQDEISLLFYKHYTRKNCQSECLANLTLTACNCVEFYMPRINETNICLGAVDRTCAKDTARKFEEDAVKRVLDGENAHGKWGPCRCLPSCTYLTYTFDVFNTDLMSADDDAAFLTFYFKENSFFPLTRIQQFDFLTFISTCGGLLGLFLGFSLLSLVEIVFYLCIAPLVSLIKKVAVSH